MEFIAIRENVGREAVAGGGDPGQSTGSHESGFNAADSFKESWHFPSATRGQVSKPISTPRLSN